ncbi:hypothetical protein PLICRDRAFT_49385 [Plicaturopsis crispa FD-325 SS-3]|nr:hypothetical protein PLICRDRAFT_49385 [Plicaturopsis crispa FD-325 SS-3]
MVIPCDLSAPIPSISSKSLLAPPVTPVSSPSHAYSLRKRKGLDTSDTNSGPAQRRKRLRTHASASPAVYTTPLPRQKYNANPVERTRLSTLPVNPDTDMEANPSTASGSPQADHVPLTIQTAESLPFSTPALTMSIAECSEAATPRRRLAGQRASGFQSPQHMQPSMSLEVPPPGDSPPGSPTIDAFSTENPEDEFTVPDWIPPEVRRQIYGSDASVLKVSNPSTPTHATSNVAARLGSSAEASPKKSHAMPSQGHANTSQTKPNLQMARFMALYHASVRPDLKHPSNERRLLPVLHDLETPPPYCYPLVTPFPTLRSVADSVKAISRVPDITVAEAGAFSQDDVPPPPSKIRDFAYEKYDGPRGYYVPHPPTAILAGRMREAHVAQQNIAKFVAAGFPHPSIVDTFEMEPARRNEYNVLTQHWRRTTKNIPCSWGKFKRSYEDAMNGLEDARIQSRIKRQKYGEAKAQNEYLSASCDEEYLLELKSRMTETELPHLADGPPILTLAQLDARQSSAVRPSSSSTQRRSALRTTPPAKAMPFTYLDNWTRSDFDISPRLGPSDEEIDRALFPVLAGEILKGVDTPGDLVELEAIEALNTRESWDVPGGASNAMDIDSSEDEYDDDEDADWDTDWDTYFDDHRGKPAVTSPVEPSISYPSLRTECEEADVPEFTGSSSIEAESAEDPMVGSPSPPPSSSSRLRPWSSLFSIFW